MAHKASCTCSVCMTPSALKQKSALDIKHVMIHDAATEPQQCMQTEEGMLGFINLLQQFEHATMERLVAISRMDGTHAMDVNAKQADAKHRDAAGKVLNAYKLQMDIAEGLAFKPNHNAGCKCDLTGRSADVCRDFLLFNHETGACKWCGHSHHCHVTDDQPPTPPDTH